MRQFSTAISPDWYFTSRSDHATLSAQFTKMLNIMFRLLFILFICVPILEIYLLIKVGSAIGAMPTVGIVVATAVIGAFLLKQQGISTIQRVQNQMARGQIPAMEMMEGLVLVFCGALLLTPGFFTDTIGFIGLVPALRQAIIRWLLRHAIPLGPNGGGPTNNSRHKPDFLEGDFKRED